jgi:hypothetical protein
MNEVAWLGALLVVASACSGGGTRDALHPRAGRAALAARCSGGSDNEVRVAGVDPDAPVIVLEEIHYHGRQPPQPTIAIWADGHVLFNHQKAVDTDGAAVFDLLEGSMRQREVETLVRSVTSALISVPRYAEAEQGYISDGGQLTTITVRDGRRWISASTYGAYEDDFLATADGPRPHIEKSVPLDANVPEREIETGRLFTASRDPPAPPPPFSKAYRQLLASRPDGGVAYAPYDFDLSFMISRTDRQRRDPREMAWPRELPRPPPAKDLSACGPSRDVCPFVLDVQYRQAAHRLHDFTTRSEQARFTRTSSSTDNVSTFGSMASTRANATSKHWAPARVSWPNTLRLAHYAEPSRRRYGHASSNEFIDECLQCLHD